MVAGGCEVWWVGGRRSGWVAGWVGEGVECGGGLDLVPEGAKNMAKRSARAQIVEMSGSFVVRECCSGNVATRSCHTFWYKFVPR